MLAERPGEVVSRSDIEASIYDENAEVMSNVVDTAIYALRRKLAAAGGAPLIATRRGQGYVLAADATMSSVRDGEDLPPRRQGARIDE